MNEQELKQYIIDCDNKAASAYQDYLNALTEREKDIYWRISGDYTAKARKAQKQLDAIKNDSHTS